MTNVRQNTPVNIEHTNYIPTYQLQVKNNHNNKVEKNKHWTKNHNSDFVSYESQPQQNLNNLKISVKLKNKK